MYKCFLESIITYYYQAHLIPNSYNFNYKEKNICCTFLMTKPALFELFRVWRVKLCLGADNQVVTPDREAVCWL